MSKPTETTTDAGPDRLRKIDLRVNDAAHATIIRAITLRLAMLGETASDDRELYGAALAAVCRDWLRTQADLLRESRA